MQPSAVWIADRMESVSLQNAAVILAGQEISATNCPATQDAPNMVNVRMGPVSALKDGMDATAHYVSNLQRAKVFSLPEKCTISCGLPHLRL